MSRTKLVEAFVRLESLKANLPNYYYVHEKYVHEYHDVLNDLSALSGSDFTKFLVPESELTNQIASINSRTGEKKYRDYKVCERSFLMMKIEGVINFFKLSNQNPDIEFRPPERKK